MAASKRVLLAIKNLETITVSRFFSSPIVPTFVPTSAKTEPILIFSGTRERFSELQFDM